MIVIGSVAERALASSWAQIKVCAEEIDKVLKVAIPPKGSYG